jgi:hypothetical protein
MPHLFARLLALALLGTFVAAGAQDTAAQTKPPSKTQDSLGPVRRAQELLGPASWSEILRIENTAAASRYPVVLYALVFQLDSALFFYTPVDGTQSLSRYLNHAEADKGDLGPLLLAIDAGFTRWNVVAPEPAAAPEKGAVPNGCFIEAIALLHQKLRQGVPIQDAKVLSYYTAVPGGVHGHSVLQYRTATGVQVVDPYRAGRVVPLPHLREDDALAVAGRLRSDVTAARAITLNEFLGNSGGALATLPPARSAGRSS